MTDTQRAMLGDHDAAARLTEQGVLIPCPFCGGRGIARYFDGKGAKWVTCEYCGADGAIDDAPKAALKNWNTRAPLLTPEQIERLEEMK